VNIFPALNSQIANLALTVSFS